MRANRAASAALERLGWVTLVAEGILLVTFFFVPAVTVTALWFTLWDFVQIDPAHPLAGASAGPFAVSGVVLTVAPLAIAFLPARAARWLRVAPLVFALLIVVRVYFGIENGVGSVASGAAVFGPTAAKIAQDLQEAATRAAFDAIHPTFGAYVFVFNALLVATQVLHAPRRR